MRMRDLQDSTGEWADKQFRKSTPSSIVAHLGAEVRELEWELSAETVAAQNVAEEAADCVLLLMHLAHKMGFDLEREALAKFKRNRERQWGEPNKQGYVEHVRDQQ